ncbi:MAG: tetratricopeptide repeat protein [candidate division Zixibacteria bacterium]|nr:tetratricopeptide repeat protein [candidate division Zixibacteria bacterium]
MRLSLTKWVCLVGVLLGTVAAADDLAARRNLAQAALLVGDYGRAVELADEILARWPDDAATHLIRGLGLVGNGEFGSAEKDLLIAREAYPDDTAVLYNLAVIAQRRGDNRNALFYVDEALAHGLSKNEAYLLKAKLLNHLGRRPEARACLERYLTQRAGSRDIYLTLAQWARADGDTEQAIKYYEQALKYGRDGGTLAELAATYEAAGDRRQAVRYYLEAVGKAAANADILAEYAATYAAASEFEESLEIYEQIVSAFPENPYYLFGLSFVRQKIGDVDQARAGYLEVVRLKPDFAEPYYNLAVLADADENAEEAAHYYYLFLNNSEGREDLAASRATAEQRLRVLESP